MQTASLTQAQADQIMAQIGIPGSVQITAVSRHNHVWRLQSRGHVFYIKTYTKEWYGEDVLRTEYCVRHERDAYGLLSRYGLPTTDVALANLDCDNPIGRPFLMTHELPGVSLMELLPKADTSQFAELLEATGDYMRQMHAITFTYPGYVTENGPIAPPDPHGWQHSCWTAQQMQTDAFAMLARDQHLLTPDIAVNLQERFTSIPTANAGVFEPPRFVHGDCHAHQFFLAQREGMWHVTGVIDMEVASAGDCMFDLIKFCLEISAFFPPSTYWWEPFFRGYGGEPDFEQFRLHMLTFGEASFKCFGANRWAGTRQVILARLLAAREWMDLFVA